MRRAGWSAMRVGDIVLRVEAVELVGLDQRIDGRGAATAGIRLHQHFPSIGSTHVASSQSPITPAYHRVRNPPGLIARL
jgi:hypothetical protein